MVFHMDGRGSKYMTNNEFVKQLTEGPDHRIAMTIAALIHREKIMEHTPQFRGLLVYTDGGDISVGWITAETQRALDGGRYMTMLI